jgi:hypothetical protein
VALSSHSKIYPAGENRKSASPNTSDGTRQRLLQVTHYIKKHMPDNMQGKVVVTNTTTAEDVELFRKCGVKYLVTTTPILEGRSFGTNMMEAALVAVSGKGRPLTWPELNEMLDKLGFEPQLQELN